MPRVRTTIKLPSVTLPSVDVPRNPPGWNTSEIRIRNRGLPGAAKFVLIEPAGDPPPGWTGTRPEWAVYWALTQIGLEPGIDFTYQAKLPGVGATYYSTLDFYVNKFHVGIDVQGSFWHYGLGSQKIGVDEVRVTLYAKQGITVIPIDEVDALANPVFYVREAIAERDHSKLTRGGR